MKKVAVLYICTGRYSQFWNNFYFGCEKFFLPNCHKEYFVFTDANIKTSNKRIHKIKQKKLGWPYDTLFRFRMFNSIKEELKKFDYLFFLNANMQFVDAVNEDILPSKKQKLLAVQHPAFYNKSRDEFTYETNLLSTAFIKLTEGKGYYMGGFNGGIATDYLQLIEQLDAAIDEDITNGIIALWHDESHLNKYFANHANIKVLDPSFGFPEGWSLPFEPKIIVLNKDKIGGHAWLRSRKKSLISKVVSYIKSGIS